MVITDEFIGTPRYFRNVEYEICFYGNQHAMVSGFIVGNIVNGSSCFVYYYLHGL